jgi:hypothetical protein
MVPSIVLCAERSDRAIALSYRLSPTIESGSRGLMQHRIQPWVAALDVVSGACGTRSAIRRSTTRAAWAS